MYNNKPVDVALICDFDGTLIPGYMQEPLLRERGIEPARFWELVERYRRDLKEAGKTPDFALSYLNFLCDCANGDSPYFGEYPSLENLRGLSNRDLRNSGKSLEFYPGLIDFIKELRELDGIRVWVYIVTSGLREIVEGSEIGPLVDGIYACEFEEREGTIYRPTSVVEKASKTRILFSINKGQEDLVDKRVPHSERKIPFNHMIALADGETDVPMLSLILDRGGYPFLVYNPSNEKARIAAEKLFEEGRGIGIFEADYRKGSALYERLMTTIKEMVSDS